MIRICWLSLLVLALLLAVGCGGRAPEPTATPPPAVSPAAQADASPTAPPVAVPASSPTALTGGQPTPSPSVPSLGTGVLSALFPDQIGSGRVRDFRARATASIVLDGENLPPTLSADLLLWEFTEEVTVDPPARRLVGYALVTEPSAGAPPSSAQSFELVQVEDVLWAKIGDQWIQVTQEAFDPSKELEAFQKSFPLDLSWERIATETVNGVRATHYRAEVSSPTLTIYAATYQTLLAAFGVELTDVTVQSATYDAYVSDDGLLVRVLHRIVWQGQHDGRPVTLTQELAYNVEGINLGLTIEPPTAPSPSAEVPLPDGATPTLSTAGMTVVTVSGVTVDQVVAFYQQALPANGFTVGSQSQLGQDVVIEASKEGATYMIAVATEDGGVRITVVGPSQ